MKTIDEILVHFNNQMAVALGINQGGAKGEAQLYAEKQQEKAKQQILSTIKAGLPEKQLWCEEYGMGASKCNKCYSCKVDDNADWQEGYEHAHSLVEDYLDKLFGSEK